MGKCGNFVCKLWSEENTLPAQLRYWCLVFCTTMLLPSLSMFCQVACASPDKAKAKFEKLNGKEYAVGSIEIDAEVNTIWDVLADYDKAPQIFSNLKLCKNIGRNGSAKLVRQVVAPGGPMQFEYIVELTEERPKSMVWHRVSGNLREVSGKWQLEPVAEGKRTRVTYSTYLDGGLLLPAWLLTGKAKGYIPTMLSSLKQHIEGNSSKPGYPTSESKSSRL